MTDLYALSTMREACRLTAQCLAEVRSLVRVGGTTHEIDSAVERYCDRHNVRSAALGYEGFPAHCCTSVNHVVAHGVPNARRLSQGDLVKIDVALCFEGWVGDGCLSIHAGDKAPVRSRRVQEVAFECLWKGIAAVHPGIRINQIGAAIDTHARRNGFAVVEEYGGHGIGQEFHMRPGVENYCDLTNDVVMEPGMLFTIEPMVNIGLRYIKVLQDGAIVTRDRSRSAQYEHTVLVTDHGCEVLTLL